MKKRLDELIEMARSGQKFEARMDGVDHWISHDKLYSGENLSFKTREILALWTVRMKREPRVIYVTRFQDGCLSTHYSSWPTVPEGCEVIKFIEVIDEP